MERNETPRAMLEGLRALDLTDDKGLLCGRILGDLGVDVIKLERPGGDFARRIGPFYHDIPHPEKSLFWFVFNANKKGVTLNLETLNGRELFKKLVERADFIIESFSAGYMERLGLGYSNLRDINPKIIMISITPFGQTGPYKDYKATDIEIMALGGMLYITGDADRSPVRLSYPIAYHIASVHATGAALIAYYYQGKSGQGQFIDVSAQHSVTRFLNNTREWWEYEGHIVNRYGQRRERQPGTYQRLMWACKDGYVSLLLFGGATGPRNNRALVQWIVEEGKAEDFFKDYDWESFDLSKVSQQVIDRLEDTIVRFFLSHTKEELDEEAKKRRIILSPVSTIGDITNSHQLASRQFWIKLEHPELGILTYPGPFVRSSLAFPAPKRRAPLIGEHNEEVYGELGISKGELVMLKQAEII